MGKRLDELNTFAGKGLCSFPLLKKGGYFLVGFVTQLFNGLSLGSIMLFIAIGLAITFGLMGVINMAHGELIMVGAYATYVVQQFLRNMHRNRWTIIISSLFLSPFCFRSPWFRIGKSLIRHLYHRPLDSLLATWGVSLILQQMARMIFGAPNVAVLPPEWLDGGVRVAGMVFPYKRLFILAFVAVSIFALYMYLNKTAAGRRIRAVTLNRDMAACLGISTQKVDAYAFAIGSGFAGLAGCALTLLGSIGPTIGTYYIVDAFMVVI